jgi:hypothetical protein
MQYPEGPWATEGSASIAVDALGRLAVHCVVIRSRRPECDATETGRASGPHLVVTERLPVIVLLIHPPPQPPASKRDVAQRAPLKQEPHLAPQPPEMLQDGPQSTATPISHSATHPGWERSCVRPCDGVSPLV